MRTERKQQSGRIILVADMNKLKALNDNFGHAQEIKRLSRLDILLKNVLEKTVFTIAWVGTSSAPL